MLSTTPSENCHVWPGDRVVDPELDVEIANPNQPMPYLGVLIAYVDPCQLALDAGFEIQSSQTAPLEAEPAGLGIVAQWSPLFRHDLLEHRRDAETFIDSVKTEAIPVTVRPLSRLRSVESSLRAAEAVGMVYGEPLGYIIDSQRPSPPLRSIRRQLRSEGYAVEYDQETESLHVEWNDRTGAIFADGMIVGDRTLRADLDELLADGS